MPANTIRRAAGLALLIFAAVLLAWGVWPLPVQTHRLEIALGDIQPEAVPGSGAAVPEEPAGVLTLEWPAAVRTGEVFSVRLALQPAAIQESGDRPRENSALAEARLELPGVETSPPGETSQAAPDDRPVRFRWQARADRPGLYSGTVWLHLRLMPGAERKIISAPRIQIRARSFLGLNGLWARGLGAAGVVLGVVFGLDALASGLWRRILDNKETDGR
jgi:hypothetical protein